MDVPHDRSPLRMSRRDVFRAGIGVSLGTLLVACADADDGTVLPSTPEPAEGAVAGSASALLADAEIEVWRDPG